MILEASTKIFHPAGSVREVAALPYFLLCSPGLSRAGGDSLQAADQALGCLAGILFFFSRLCAPPEGTYSARVRGRGGLPEAL